MIRRPNIRILVYSTIVILATVLSIGLPIGSRLVTAASSRADDPLWQEIASGSFETLRSGQQSRLAPERYKAFQLNESALANVLADAPMEFTAAGKDPQNEIVLPMPDGSFARFRFVESPIMAPELAAKSPDIKTYRGWGIDDQTATTRFDRTSDGFHAIVLSPQGAFYIAPLFRGDTRNYASYFMRDAGGAGAECEVDRDLRGPRRGETSEAQRSGGISPNNVNGGTLRTFRLAVGATAEYTAAFGSSANALNAINTTVNNVTAIYQREMAVSFTLVATFIFTDPVGDPYTSGNKGDMLDENQDVMDGALGDGGYDVGHVFDGSQVGGRASLGVVCNDGDKARAVSGLSSPSGTVFDLTVTHEMGHQFGAHHTFNGTLAACGSGQRDDDTAYEPGSGSTIMAYPGACGIQSGMCVGPGDGDNLQCRKDAYFHGVSLSEMADYLNNCAGCATTSNIGNTAPNVSAPLPVSPTPLGHFLIPMQTPFALTASATDAEDTNLTFCWEDFDKGSPGPPTGDRGDNPLFRSRPPTSNRTRTFPQMSDLLNGTSTPGETIPTTQRYMGFRVTARDNHPGGGGFDQADVVVDTWAPAGPFVVTGPPAGTQALEGSSLTVTWNVARTDLRPISTSNVRILLSTDDGATFPAAIAASTPNDGSHTFFVPRLYTQKARILVEAIDNIFFNVSPIFTIIPRPIITATGSLSVTCGGPSVTAAVARVEDQRDPISSLAVRLTTSLPNGVTLSPPTVDAQGIVSFTATAQCTTIHGTRPITLEVRNTAGLTASTNFNLVVVQNPPPILGNYNNATVIASQAIAVSPSVPPSDPNGTSVQTTASIVVPTPVPGAATLSVNQTTGVVTIFTSGTMRLGVHQIQVRAEDSCGTTTTKTFFLTVNNSGPQININGNPVRTTAGGVSTAPVTVGTVSDAQDAAGALTISPSYPVGFPSGLTVSPSNSNGTITATATAACNVPASSYTATLTVRDSSNDTASATITIIVTPHLPPTLGTYLDSSVTVGALFDIIPTVPPSDPNNPNSAVTLTVNPGPLPGGGMVTVTSQSTGRLRATTFATTVLATYQVIVTATDACGIQSARSFKLTVRSANCILEQGVLFAADTGNNRVQRFGGAWNVIAAGTPGSGLGQFMRPESAVASPDGRKFYVADTGNRRIQWSQDSGGTWAVFASSIVPQGLVLDRDGNLYVADAQDNLVLRYPGGVPGTPIVLAGSGSGAGRVRNPNGLAIDCRMNLYIADTGNNRILVIANADSVGFPNLGTVLAGSGAGLNPAQVTAPQGVAVDNSGKLYIADTGNDRVLMIASAPLPGAATVLCSVGAALGQVRRPEGVTIATLTSGPLAGVESIIVSDTNNHRIQGRNLLAVSWMLIPPPMGGGPGAGVGQFSLPSKIR